MTIPSESNKQLNYFEAFVGEMNIFKSCLLELLWKDAFRGQLFKTVFFLALIWRHCPQIPISMKTDLEIKKYRGEFIDRNKVHNWTVNCHEIGL